jgi:hypothetical protein
VKNERIFTSSTATIRSMTSGVSFPTVVSVRAFHLADEKDAKSLRRTSCFRQNRSAGPLSKERLDRAESMGI